MIPVAPSAGDAIGSGSETRRIRIVVIDPGMRGAVAVLVIEVAPGLARIIGVEDLFDMPLREDSDGVLHVNFRGLVTRLGPHRAEFGIIELQHAMRKQSATGAWKQCEAYRDAYCALLASVPSVIGVHGRVWKPGMGLTSVKQLSLDAARRLFPAMRHLLTRQMDEGRAEALLLGEYACRHILNQETVITV
jgi:hypothetical protein